MNSYLYDFHESLIVAKGKDGKITVDNKIRIEVYTEEAR
jgi:hypothetical protein